MPSDACQRNTSCPHDASLNLSGETRHTGVQNNHGELFIRRCRQLPLVQRPTCSRNQCIGKYSSEGRPFDPDFDLIGNHYANSRSYSPPNLRGRALNIAMEVDRSKQIAWEQAKARATLACEMSRTNADCRADRTKFTDSMVEDVRGSKSNGCIPYHSSEVYRSEEEIKSCSPRLSKMKSARATSCPRRLISSRDMTNSYMSQTPDLLRSTEAPAFYSVVGASPIQRSVLRQKPYPSLQAEGTITGPVMTTTGRGIPNQSHPLIDPNSFTANVAQLGETQRGDKVQYNDHTPREALSSQRSLQTKDPPLNSHIIANSRDYQEITPKIPLYRVPSILQNTLSTAGELTFDTPKSESTRYQDIVDQKSSTYGDIGRVSQDISQTEAAERFQSREAPSRQGASDMSNFCNQSHKFNNSPNQYGQQSPKKQAMERHQPSCIDRTNESSYAHDATEIVEACPVEAYECSYSNYETLQNHTPASNIHSSIQMKSPASKTQRPMAIRGSLYDNFAYKDSPTLVKTSGESQSTEPLPIPVHLPVCTPCPQETPVSALFRCLAKKLSSTLHYLSSFVMSQRPMDSEAVATESRRPCPPEPYERNAFSRCGQAYIRDTAAPEGFFPTFLTQRNAKDFDRGLFSNHTKNPDKLRSVSECSEAKKCGRVQFDSDTGEVHEPRRDEMRKHQLQYLVEDTYCPGIIQDTLDESNNFNKMSFNISLGERATIDVADICEMSPSQDPMTLLEAFSMRVDKERSEVTKRMTEDATDILIKEAIEAHFATKNPTDLNRSIKSLLLSEALMEHGEIATSNASTLTADLRAKTIPINIPGIMYFAYIGRTKPSEDIAE